MPRLHLRTWIPYAILAFLFVVLYSWRLVGWEPPAATCFTAGDALPQLNPRAVATENANVPPKILDAIDPANFIVDDGVASVQLPACTRPRINTVYIKLHKCASDTVVNVLHRFGIRHNLTFVLPVPGRMTLGFPYRMEMHFFRPLKTKHFNILCQHVVYTPDVMSRIMPPDSVYFTSIREPFARMKSAFRFFNIHARAGFPRGPDELEHYLAEIPRFERALKSPDNYAHRKSCIPLGYSFTLNGMAFGLGFDTGFHRDTVDQSNNATYIRQWLGWLDRRFSIVMVIEYFHESLVLLRRLMCWSTEDILYIKRNANQYAEKSKETDPSLVANFRRYNIPDYALYDHFNRTLWRKIAAAGDDFWAEVRHLDDIIDSIARFCESPQTRATLVIPKSQWNDDITLRGWYCDKMSKRIYDDLTDIYEAMPEQKIRNRPYVPGC
ncbi:Galactose-3-O-sulfotransferase 3 [Lamellibrachia satsuma]|nr:Galactose-3-O-sulfotransferase 3 [Lamellibrachia satsuma]